MLDILERYQWDYHTYMDQPAWLLDLIVKKLEIEAQKAKTESLKHHGVVRK